MLSCFRSSFKDKVQPIIRGISIEENRRKILIARFVEEVELYDRKAKVAETFYIFPGNNHTHRGVKEGL